MPYLTAEHLKVALDYLADDTHSFLVSLLAAWRSDLKEAAGDLSYVRFGAPQENELLKTFSAPPGGHEGSPIYVPFGDPQGKGRWRTLSYSGSSLQRQRKDRPEVLVQEPLNNKFWAFAPGALDAVLKAPESYIGSTPVVLPYIGAWFFRDTAIGSVDELGPMVVEACHIPKEWIAAGLFTLSPPASFLELPLGDQPLSQTDILSVLQPFGAPISDATPGGGWAEFDGSMVDELGGLVGLERPALQALAALKAGLHVVFTGPPGTGKTSLAAALLDMAGLPYVIAPATDAWTTFETIGGYFPVPEQSGEERLDFLPGAVVSSIQNGKCIIVDELNRADIDKAFGELFTLLAGAPVELPYRRRDGGDFKRVRLSPVTGAAADADVHEIVVPKEWRMIGTMNDADKASLKRLSLAFVRRFAFVPVPVPGAAEYSALLTSEIAGGDPNTSLVAVKDALVVLFADAATGMKSIGFPVGAAIPKVMLRQAASELSLSPDLSMEQVLASALTLYLAPQLQGRSDLHVKVVSVVTPFIGGQLAQGFSESLAVWTGHT